MLSAKSRRNGARGLAESSVALAVVAALLPLCAVASTAGAPNWQFTDVTDASGAGAAHAHLDPTQVNEAGLTAAGVAVGDYDGDGWLDLYTIGGSAGSNRLLRNRGDGSFEDRAQSAGVALPGTDGAGPTFADVDGDGWTDLLVLGVNGTLPRLFRNRGNGSFEDVSARSGLSIDRDSYSAAFADYDRDGDLDLAVSHWATFGPAGSTQHLWRNDGDFRFTDVSLAAGVSPSYFDSDGVVFQDFSFTPNFADIDDDGWPDLLMAGDFRTSKLFRNRRDGSFENITEAVISDENGMGAAIGDYDNDGDLDWFVSSIFDPNGIVEPGGFWFTSGNRMYRNAGGGRFADATDAAGVRDGSWGWASTFADLNNDGHLDLVHVNGWGPLSSSVAAEYHADTTRIFINRGDASFAESAAQLGVHDTGQGRGVLSFDYDRDGDLDLFIANNQQPARLLRNDGGNSRHWLTVTLRSITANSAAVGARVWIDAGDRRQMRELRAGSNFVSHDPIEAHFGLAQEQVAHRLRIVWPQDGSQSLLHNLSADRHYAITQLAAGCSGDCDANGAVSAAELQRAIEALFDPTAGCNPSDSVSAATVLAAVRFVAGCVGLVTHTRAEAGFD